MPLKTKEENKKSELTSIIDVVFLLLIFFLVTLSIAPKKSEQGENIRVIKREITQPKNEKKVSGAKQKVDCIVQILNRKNSTFKYVIINGQNFQIAKQVINIKKSNKLSDNSPNFIKLISQPGPFGPNALCDINRLASLIKTGDKVSIRAPEMLSFENLIEIYDLVKNKKATAYWGLGPIDSLWNLEFFKDKSKWSKS